MLVTCNFRFYNIRTEHNMRYTLITIPMTIWVFPLSIYYFLSSLKSQNTTTNNILSTYLLFYHHNYYFSKKLIELAQFHK